MGENDKTYRIFISAAEASGDSHSAELIEALKRSDYNIEFVGVGGDKMEAAGCRLLAKTTDKAAMAYKALRQVLHFYKLIRQITAFLKNEKVDVVIVCDSPAFNFHVAKAAKKAGIKTVFYVAPQLWAWGRWRIEKLKRCCDKLCCILPFEQRWFEEKGVEAVFVGNPLLDGDREGLEDHKKTYADFEVSGVRIALMPGSRADEIKTLWEPMQRIALAIKRKFPNADFTAVAVDEKGKDILKSIQVLGFRCKYSAGSVLRTADECDFSIVASGSATLQVAAAGCPMVIMYQTSKIIWQLVGRWLLKTEHLSLVNILAKRELVPEFMPYFSSIEPVIEKVCLLLEDKRQLARTSEQLIELAGSLGEGSTAKKVAKIVTEMFV